MGRKRAVSICRPFGAQILPIQSTIDSKYDPMGNRVSKRVSDITDPQNPVTEEEWKYLVDIAGGLSTIIGEIEADSSSPDYGSLKKSYFYADGQTLKLSI